MLLIGNDIGNPPVFFNLWGNQHQPVQKKLMQGKVSLGDIPNGIVAARNHLIALFHVRKDVLELRELFNVEQQLLGLLGLRPDRNPNSTKRQEQTNPYNDRFN